jgi:DNA-binding beta-propeller fold protein YncE
MFQVHKKWILKGRTFATLLMVGTLSLTLVPGAQAKKKKEAAAAPAPVDHSKDVKVDTNKLVWPSPPDIARIRWLQEFKAEPQTAEQLAGPPKKKKSWMDKVAGVQEAAEARKGSGRHYLMKPYGVVIDSKGRIYAADTYVSAVFIFDPATNKLTLIRNGLEARFKTIIGLAIDDNDRLFVSDADLHNVCAFDAAGKVEKCFGDDALTRPSGMAIDTENRFLYVVDVEKQQVAVFDADNFKFLRYVGGPPKKVNDDSPGTFTKPSNVAVDSDGNVYVADTFNNRIQIFDADGQFISMFGKNGDGLGEFIRPKGVGVDRDGHIWVADAMQNRVQIFDREGHVVGYFGSAGTLPGQFGLATGLYVDNKTNKVVVADQMKGRVQLFQYTTDQEAAALKSGGGLNTSTPAAPPSAAANVGAPAAPTAAPKAAEPEKKK